MRHEHASRRVQHSCACKEGAPRRVAVSPLTGYAQAFAESFTVHDWGSSSREGAASATRSPARGLALFANQNLPATAQLRPRRPLGSDGGREPCPRPPCLRARFGQSRVRWFLSVSHLRRPSSEGILRPLSPTCYRALRCARSGPMETPNRRSQVRSLPGVPSPPAPGRVAPGAIRPPCATRRSVIARVSSPRRPPVARPVRRRARRAHPREIPDGQGRPRPHRLLEGAHRARDTRRALPSRDAGLDARSTASSSALAPPPAERGQARHRRRSRCAPGGPCRRGLRGESTGPSGPGLTGTGGSSGQGHAGPSRPAEPARVVPGAPATARGEGIEVPAPTPSEPRGKIAPRLEVMVAAALPARPANRVGRP
jgi:hypothetical protein